MASFIESLRTLITGEGDKDYEVKEYVLERREPDPDPRVMTYDEVVTPDDVVADDELPSGNYLLQEVKTSGMAGEVVWEEDLTFEE